VRSAAYDALSDGDAARTAGRAAGGRDVIVAAAGTRVAVASLDAAAGLGGAVVSCARAVTCSRGGCAIAACAPTDGGGVIGRETTPV
jgi:Tfp pilus assembly protein PilW